MFLDKLNCFLKGSYLIGAPKLLRFNIYCRVPTLLCFSHY